MKIVVTQETCFGPVVRTFTIGRAYNITFGQYCEILAENHVPFSVQYEEVTA